jgi:hypothetical protein
MQPADCFEFDDPHNAGVAEFSKVTEEFGRSPGSSGCGTRQSATLARTDMIAEGTVMVFNEKQTTALKVALLRNGEHQSQRILLYQDGKMWDGRGENLTSEGKRVLDFLETQYMRGLRQMLKANEGAFTVTAASLMLQKDGENTTYFLDSDTSRLSHFEFEHGQQLDSKGRARTNVHSYSYATIAVRWHRHTVSHRTRHERQQARGIAAHKRCATYLQPAHGINRKEHSNGCKTYWTLVFDPDARNSSRRHGAEPTGTGDLQPRLRLRQLGLHLDPG